MVLLFKKKPKDGKIVEIALEGDEVKVYEVREVEVYTVVENKIADRKLQIKRVKKLTT